MASTIALLNKRGRIYFSIAANEEKRRQYYAEYLSYEVPNTEQAFLKNAYQRNQLTGNHRFIDEIEQRIGIRIEQRGRGRPAAKSK